MAPRYLSRQTRRRAERLHYGGGWGSGGSGGSGPQIDWPIIGRCISAGGTALVVTLAIGSLSPAGLINMATAYGMLVAAWVLGILVIVFSETVWGFPVRHRVIFGVGGSLTLGLLLFSLGRYEYFQNFELTHLIADDKPTPPNRCGSPSEKTVTVILGSNVYFAQHFPHTVIAVGVDNNNNPYPLLQIGKDADSVSVKILRIFSLF
jgi:hypothetical protein